MPGIEPGAFHMQSERSTAELHPLSLYRNPSWPDLPLSYIPLRRDKAFGPNYRWATSPCAGIKPCDPVRLGSRLQSPVYTEYLEYTREEWHMFNNPDIAYPAIAYSMNSIYHQDAHIARYQGTMNV